MELFYHVDIHYNLRKNNYVKVKYKAYVCISYDLLCRNNNLSYLSLLFKLSFNSDTTSYLFHQLLSPNEQNISAFSRQTQSKQ